MPWLRSSANKVQTNVFCCCLIVNYGVALHRTCYTIVCIVPWCPAVYKTSTASIQSIGFTVTGIPFCLSELLISFACDLWVWNVRFRLVLFSVIHNVAVETKPFLGVSCTRSTFLKWLPDEGKDIFRWYDEKKTQVFSFPRFSLCYSITPFWNFWGPQIKIGMGFFGG